MALAGPVEQVPGREQPSAVAGVRGERSGADRAGQQADRGLASAGGRGHARRDGVEGDVPQFAVRATAVT